MTDNNPRRLNSKYGMFVLFSYVAQADQFVLALEGITDSIVNELDPAWNIKVCGLCL